MVSKQEIENTLNWYRMALDKMIAEREESAADQKELMDLGNSYAAGRWAEMNDTARQLKWIRNGENS